jgi:hypothetical protein
MSQDFEDKEQHVPDLEEEVPSPDHETVDEQDESRRGFLKSLGKWSGAAIGIALLGAALTPTDAEADSSEKPEESWRCWRCWRCRCRCRCRCW